MKKFFACLTAAALMLSLGNVVSFADNEKKAETTVTGFIVDSHCKGEGAKDGHKDCALKCAKEKGATLGVWDAASSKFYALDDQKKAQEFAGSSVTVKGTVDGETIRVSSIAKAEAKPAGK
jgi:hypothetical protein